MSCAPVGQSSKLSPMAPAAPSAAFSLDDGAAGGAAAVAAGRERRPRGRRLGRVKAGRCGYCRYPTCASLAPGISPLVLERASTLRLTLDLVPLGSSVFSLARCPDAGPFGKVRPAFLGGEALRLRHALFLLPPRVCVPQSGEALVAVQVCPALDDGDRED